MCVPVVCTRGGGSGGSPASNETVCGIIRLQRWASSNGCGVAVGWLSQSPDRPARPRQRRRIQQKAPHISGSGGGFVCAGCQHHRTDWSALQQLRELLSLQMAR